MRIGLIGFGTMGRFLYHALTFPSPRLEPPSGAEVVAICAQEFRDAATLETVKRELEGERAQERERAGAPRGPAGMPRLTGDVDGFIEARPQVAVEVASQEAVRQLGERLLDAGIDLVVASVGALMDAALLERLREKAVRSGARIWIPSGAIGGLDAIWAAASGGALDEVSLVTRKPPQGLGMGDAGVPQVLFEGDAAEGVRRFPRNVNVAAALSLAGLGPQRTRVRVVADPQAPGNEHRIVARGPFGEVEMTFRNVPFTSNPRTSYLAALSILGLLRRMASPVQV